MIGLFSFPEVLQMLETDGEGFSEVNEAGKLYLKANDFLKNKLTLIRSTIIGVVIGIIPAAGPDIAAFLSYNEAKKASKKPEEFGNGQ